MQVVNYMVLIGHNEISVLFEWRPMNSTPSGRQTKEEGASWLNLREWAALLQSKCLLLISHKNSSNVIFKRTNDAFINSSPVTRQHTLQTIRTIWQINKSSLDRKLMIYINLRAFTGK